MNRAHSNQHWAVQGRINRKWRQAALLSVKSAGLPQTPVSFVRVRYTRHSSSEPDYDNLVISTKAITDGICQALKIDDSPSTFQAEWAWEKSKRGAGHIRIEIWGYDDRAGAEGVDADSGSGES
jgi:hypothetical protein